MRKKMHAALCFAVAPLALAGNLLAPAIGAAQASAPSPIMDGYRIAGTMVDAMDGRPISHAIVTVAPATGGDARSVTTGDDGKFVFEHVAQGKYRLSARRRGYAPRQYNQHEEFTSAIATGPAKDSDKIRFAMYPGAVIAGVVSDEASEAVRGANVQLFHKVLRDGKSQTKMDSQTTTDDEGHYRFAALDAGTYMVAVDAVPWYADAGAQRGDFVTLDGVSRTDRVAAARTARSGEPVADPAFDVIYPETCFSNANSLAEAVAIRLKSGDLARADVTLNPIPALHLLVHTRGSDESVFVRSDWGSYVRTLASRPNSSASGSVDIGGLGPGPVTVFVVSPGEGKAKSQTQSLVLSGNGEVDSSTFAEGANISGVIKMIGRSSLPSETYVTLQKIDAHRGSVPARADGKGEFRIVDLNVEAGAYEISVGAPAGAVITGMSASGATVDGTRLIIGAEREVRLTLTVVVGSSSVSGIALKNDQPLEGAMMLLVPQDNGRSAALYRRDQSDSDGTFTFGNVVPGHYIALAIEDGWELEWSRPEVIEKYLAHGEQVVVGRDGIDNLKLDVQ